MEKELLNGGYQGLYGEVVEQDTYRLKRIDFVPDIIIDIGANIGIFSRFARTLFPDTKIIAIEPDPGNIKIFRQFPADPNILLVEKALGRGRLFHGTTEANGSGAVYLSAGLGYPEKEMEEAADHHWGMEVSSVPTITLEQIVQHYVPPGKRTLLKLDCEGAENTIWSDRSSLEALRVFDYIAAEIHFFALHGGQLPSVLEATHNALKSLEATHTCELEGVYFWARKNSI